MFLWNVYQQLSKAYIKIMEKVFVAAIGLEQQRNLEGCCASNLGLFCL